MPLTDAESEFLAVYAYEYMRVEFGPASRKLRERGFVYTDLTYLLDAFVRNDLYHMEAICNETGIAVEDFVIGRKDESPPDPPWPSREAAQTRNAELLAERDVGGGDPALRRAVPGRSRKKLRE